MAGILVAAFYNPVWSSTIHGLSDIALACKAYLFPEVAGVAGILAAAVTGLGAGRFS